MGNHWEEKRNKTSVYYQLQSSRIRKHARYDNARHTKVCPVNSKSTLHVISRPLLCRKVEVQNMFWYKPRR